MQTNAPTSETPVTGDQAKGTGEYLGLGCPDENGLRHHIVRGSHGRPMQDNTRPPVHFPT